jgi:hypothetical protein
MNAVSKLGECPLCIKCRPGRASVRCAKQGSASQASEVSATGRLYVGFIFQDSALPPAA